jgi:splicing factor 3B subunit 3
VVIEADHNAYTEETKQSRKLQMAEEMREAAGEDEQVFVVDLRSHSAIT